jgi:hypothetical protein
MDQFPEGLLLHQQRKQQENGVLIGRRLRSDKVFISQGIQPLLRNKYFVAKLLYPLLGIVCVLL